VVQMQTASLFIIAILVVFIRHTVVAQTETNYGFTIKYPSLKLYAN